MSAVNGMLSWLLGCLAGLIVGARAHEIWARRHQVRARARRIAVARAHRFAAAAAEEARCQRIWTEIQAAIAQERALFDAADAVARTLPPKLRAIAHAETN